MLTHSAYGSLWGGLQGPPWSGPRTSACISSPCHLGHSSAGPGVLFPPIVWLTLSPPSSLCSDLLSMRPLPDAIHTEECDFPTLLPCTHLPISFALCLSPSDLLSHWLIMFTVYVRLPLHENASFPRLQIFLLFMEVSRCSVNTWGRSELTVDFVLFSLVQ